jgi:hypothetical protein
MILTARRGEPELRRGAPNPQELHERLIGTRAELEIRIQRVLEQIMRLQLDGRDAEARSATRELCDAMDASIEVVTTLAARDS